MARLLIVKLEAFVVTAADSPAFEVASVKPSGDSPHPLGIGLYTYPGAGLSAASAPWIT